MQEKGRIKSLRSRSQVVLLVKQYFFLKDLDCASIPTNLCDMRTSLPLAPFFYLQRESWPEKVHLITSTPSKKQ